MKTGEGAVYIVGPRTFQNSMMVFYLQGNLGLNCFSHTALTRIPRDAGRESLPPKLVLYDCLFQDREAISRLLPETRGICSESRLALFNVAEGIEIESEALGNGVRGFFYENDPAESLLKGIRAMFEGELWLSRKMMSQCLLTQSVSLPHRDSVSSLLTERERVIMVMVAKGAKNENIAEKFCISTHTVKTHVYNIFKKIKVTNRLQAALWAAKNL
jgi:LuxR family transcriptional regulator of csgAB operon